MTIMQPGIIWNLFRVIHVSCQTDGNTRYCEVPRSLAWRRGTIHLVKRCYNTLRLLRRGQQSHVVNYRAENLPG